MKDDLDLLKERVNLRLKLWSFLIAIAGIGILFLSTPVEKAGYHKWGALLQETGAALFIAGVLAVIWELAGKRAFADEILAKANMARDLAEAGVDTIAESFKHHRIEWDELFNNACRLDVFVAWGATWRNTQSEQIEKFLHDPDAKLRVVLPDPDAKLRVVLPDPDAKLRVVLPDPDVPRVVENLAARFSMDVEDVKRKIEEARYFFQHEKAKASCRGAVDIYFSGIIPVFTFYQFNNKAVLALYNHRSGKVPVPAVVCDREGFLYSFIAAEFEGILADSRTRPAAKEEGAAASDGGDATRV